MKVNLLSIYLLKERLANHSATTGQLLGGAWGEGHGAGGRASCRVAEVAWGKKAGAPQHSQGTTQHSTVSFDANR